MDVVAQTNKENGERASEYALAKVPLSTLDYIPIRHLNILKKFDINTVYDLLTEFPTRYENFIPRSLTQATLEENIVLEGNICSKVNVNYLRNRLTTLTFYVEVEGQAIRCTLFNRQYLKTKLRYGVLVRVSGKFNQNLHNFTVASIILCDEVNRDLVPIYRIKEIGDSKYLNMMEKVYDQFKYQIEEELPEELINKYHLISQVEVIKLLHFPQNLEEIEAAKTKMKYIEIFKHQLSLKYIQAMRHREPNGNSIIYNEKIIEDFISKLPFELTADQKITINEILHNMREPYQMNRLLQGEVGSGKTIVAAIVMLAAVSAGFQAALLCPTEILAYQHYETLKKAYAEYEMVNLAILTSSINAKDRKKTLEDLAEGKINILIGTHAIFQKDVIYHNLGIVIADEEHRFGVRQRVSIRNKGKDVDYLKMSATPIPRSLAITAYGDNEMSVIRTMPTGRKDVVTKFVTEDEKRLVVNHMIEEIKNGHQIYVVTPLINESEAIDTANATKIYENMKSYFDGIAKVGLIHGRLKSEDREQVMEKFLNKEIQILVATSVIEVGVNIPNATTIVILGAERFGVAQLHQLRGRVMRSDAVPYCFLISDMASEAAIERLRMVEENSDGFALADYDLKVRGPGEFFGEKQSGAMNFKFCDLREDTDLFVQLDDDAHQLIKNPAFETDPKYAYLYEYVKEINQRMKVELD